MNVKITPKILLASLSILSALSSYAIPQGSLILTGRALDMAINGTGWFVLRDSITDERYVTRRGMFYQDACGYICNNEGLRLQGEIYSSDYSKPKYHVSLSPSGSLMYERMEIPGEPTGSLGDIQINNYFTIDTNGMGLGGTLELDAALLESNKNGLSMNRILSKSPKACAYGIQPDGNFCVRLSDGSSFRQGKILLQQFAEDEKIVPFKDGLFLLHSESAAPQILDVDHASPGTNGLGIIHSGSLEVLSVSDIVARIGRDAFLVLKAQLAEREDIISAIEEIRKLEAEMLKELREVSILSESDLGTSSSPSSSPVAHTSECFDHSR